MNSHKAASSPRLVTPRTYRRGGPPTILERGLGKLRLSRLILILRRSIEFAQALPLDLAERGKTAADRIAEILEGQRPTDPAMPVLIYAHYTRSGRVTPMVHRQLAAYVELGFAIVFVTMSSQLDADDAARLKARCALVVRRRSFGRDFGAWADIWPEVRRRFPDTEEVLLANDSMVGPLAPLNVLFRDLRMHEGFIGLTESFEQFHHLQSYFLLLRGRAAIAEADHFFSTLVLSADKRKMIKRGELGFSDHMAAQGIPAFVAYPLEALETLALRDSSNCSVLLSLRPWMVGGGGVLPVDENLSLPQFYRARSSFFVSPINPTHFMWSALVRLMGFPFIKTELLLANPSRIPDVTDWQSVVPADSPTPVEEIENHLAELSRPARQYRSGNARMIKSGRK